MKLNRIFVLVMVLLSGVSVGAPVAAAKATEPPPLTVKWFPESREAKDVYIERNQTAGGFVRLRWATPEAPMSWEWSTISGGLAFWGECFQDLGVRYVKETKTVGAHYVEEVSERDCIPTEAEYYGE